MEVGEDEVSEIEAEWDCGVFLLRNCPKRFIPLEIKLARPSFNSRPWKSPSEVGEVTPPADREDGLEGVFLTAAPLLESPLLKAEGKVL